MSPGNPIARSQPDPWSVVTTEDGSPTVYHQGVGQTCHSDFGAWTEAREVYAAASCIRQRALAGELRTCRLLDVGTGLGWNLAAALEALDGTGCELKVVALESDPRVLAHAVELAKGDSPGEMARYWRSVTALFEQASARPRSSGSLCFGADRGELRLLLGDARETLPRLMAEETELAFDAVFLDPFSPAADPPLWEASFLQTVARSMAPGSRLATYCAASRVRLRLARAGLRVGRGPGIGNKAEGTVASPDRALPPLPARAAANLARALASGREG